LKVKNKESTLNWAFEKGVRSDFFGRYCTPFVRPKRTRVYVIHL
jgi:hypothetical protein